MTVPSLPVISHPDLYRRFDKDVKTYRFVYLGGHIGWGKTTAVTDWLLTRQMHFVYSSASQDDFCSRLAELVNQPPRVIVMDDLHVLSDGYVLEQVTELMKRLPKNCCLFLIGRAQLPSWLKPYLITNQLHVYDFECLRFTADEAGALLTARGVPWDVPLLAQAMKKTKGWPLGLSLLAARLQMNPSFDNTLCHQLDLDVFDCFDIALFSKWEDDIRHFMLRMAAFDTFTEEMARNVTGKPNASALLSRIVQLGSFLALHAPDTYVMHPLFHKYLMKKQRENRSSEFIAQMYTNAGLYYELQCDLPAALSYYKKAGNMEKITELLIENAARSVANGSFLDVAQYYQELPEQTVLESPELMCAMAVLHSLRYQAEESEAWVKTLEAFQASIPKSDIRYSTASEALAYLYICLPHRGSGHVAQLITSAAKLLGKRSKRLQETSVTGNCPSLLSGGKDFCTWVPHAKPLYRLMKVPIETVFCRSGVGLLDIALGETLYETNSSGNYTEALIHLNTGLSQAEASGTLEMQFVAIGVMSRMFAAQGSLDTATALMENFCLKAVRQNAHKLVKNIRAFRIRQHLLSRNAQAAEEWLEQEAPDEMADFCILERYRYLTKIRVYLFMEDWPKAVLLIGRMRAYFETYQRPFNLAEANLLYAVVLKRMKDDSWRAMFEKVLLFCEKYGFVRLIADEGVVAYELMKACQPVSPSLFFTQVMEIARRQAVLYPNYLKPCKKVIEPLTETEKSVLRLLVGGKKNIEIAHLMGITQRTVKFHNANIYGKLCVKNRTEVMIAAAELGLEL